MLKEQELFLKFLKDRHLKLTCQRDQILKIFLSSNRHLSVEDLYGIVKKQDSSIGQATVFRTLKLLREAGIANEVHLGDKKTRYEQKDGQNHHDHLVCTKCGKLIEAVEPRIERLQNALCEKFDFSPLEHKMEIYGICKDCKNIRH